MIFQLLLTLLLLPPSANGLPLEANQPVEDSIRFYDGFSFDIIGKYHDEKHYGRFPASYEKTLRDKVWSLGRNSAGIGIRFRTNATTIVVRWTVMNRSQLPHMPATGVRGVDLYAYVKDAWRFVRTGFPSEETTEYTLLQDGDGVDREYVLNLPLYDGVKSLEIGVNESAEITRAKDQYLLAKKPVVYYGTSIAQGACASRPGLAYTNILARKLDRSFINLGFSGNGTFETSVGQAMCEVDAALYVIDCIPNTNPELVYERTLELVKLLKQKRPDVPVLLVEGFLNESYYLNPASGVHDRTRKKNEELKKAFDTLKKSGVTDLHFLKADGMIGNDREATVDGIHPNDIGMMRMADTLLPAIKKNL